MTGESDFTDAETGGDLFRERLTHLSGAPEELKELETLSIFGWNADYVQAFRKMLDDEGLAGEIEVPVRTLFDPWPTLYVPRTRGEGSRRADRLRPGGAPRAVGHGPAPRRFGGL